MKREDMHNITITDAQPDRLFIADFTNYESLLLLEMLRNVYEKEEEYWRQCALLDIDDDKHRYIFERIINWLEKGEI